MATAFNPLDRPEFISQTARYREIAKLEAILEGKQYDGRPDWWTGKHPNGGKEHPLTERKPCVIYRLPHAAVQQVVRFLFGDGRFPSVSVDVPEDGATDDLYPALSEEQSVELEAWISDLIDDANLQPTMRAIAGKAIACKTAVVILEAVNGELKATLPRPQDCAAKFIDDRPDGDVERLVWCYEFDKEITDEQGKPTTKRHLFRRDYDAAAVYVYADVELEHGKDVEWPAPQVQPHGLTFCPVLWLRNECEYADGIDGRSLYEDSAEEIEALDMTLSRRHQGLIYLGAPQLIETAEDYETTPDALGRAAAPEAAYVAGTGERKLTVKQAARKTGPEHVWHYQGKDVSVELLETTGKAFEVATNHVNDLRGRLLETWGVVLASMTDTLTRNVTTGAEMSARFLALAHAPLIALVQEYRHSWWPHGLRRVLSMCMRMSVDLAAQGQRLNIPNSTAASELLSQFYRDGGWVCPRMKPHWGKFFDPSALEIGQSVEAASKAKEALLISTTTATEHVAHAFGVEDINEELDEIEDDKAEAEAKAAEEAERQAEALHSMAITSGGSSANGTGAAGRSKPPNAPGGGSSGPTDTDPKPARSRGKRQPQRPR